MSKTSKRNIVYSVLIYLSYRIAYCFIWYFDNPEDSYGLFYLMTGLIIILPLVVGLLFSFSPIEKDNISYWIILFFAVYLIANITELFYITIQNKYYTYESFEALKKYFIQNIKERSFLNIGPIIDSVSYIFGVFLKNKHK